MHLIESYAALLIDSVKVTHLSGVIQTLMQPRHSKAVLMECLTDVTVRLLRYCTPATQGKELLSWSAGVVIDRD